MQKTLNFVIKNSLYLLVFLIPLFWLPLSFEAFEFNKQYLLFFLVSLGFLVWLIKQVIIDKEIKFKRTVMDIPVLLFLIVAILSTITSVDSSSSLFGSYGRFSDGLVGLISLVLFYFLITNNVSVRAALKTKDKKDDAVLNIPYTKLLKIFSWSVGFVVLITFLSLFGVWRQIATSVPMPFPMLSSVFNPVAGSLEGLAIFLSVFLVLLTSQLVKGGRGRIGKITKWVLFAAIFLLLFIIDFTAAWIIVLVSSVLFVAFCLWKRILRENVNKLLLPIFLAVIAIVFLGVDTSTVQFPGVIPLAQEQVLSQGFSWQAGFGGATEGIKSIFLGSGPGTFHYDFAKFKPMAFNENFLWQIRFDRAGSYIAEVLGTMGFLGLLSYLFLIGMFLFLSYKLMRAITEKKKKEEPERESSIVFFFLPLWMMFLALLIGQFVYYQNTVLAFTFWFVIALSVVSWQRPGAEKTFSFKDFPELSLVFSTFLIVFLLIVLGVFFFGFRFYSADVKFAQAVSTGDIQSLKEATNLNPYQSQYKMILARAYLNEVIAEAQKPAGEQDQVAMAGNISLAVTYAKGGLVGGNEVKGAVEISPNRVAAQETLAMIYRDIRGLAAGSLEWGIKAFQDAIALEPTNPVLHTELGTLYWAAGDQEKAKENFNKASILKPSYVGSAIQSALLSEEEGELDLAISQLEEFIGSNPLNINVLFQLGRLYFNAQRTDEAILQFERVVLILPTHSNAHYSLGIAYESKGQTTKAIAAFERVLELNPGNKDVQSRINNLKSGD